MAVLFWISVTMNTIAKSRKLLPDLRSTAKRFGGIHRRTYELHQRKREALLRSVPATAQRLARALDQRINGAYRAQATVSEASQLGFLLPLLL